jgi:hypothetical protein
MARPPSVVASATPRLSDPKCDQPQRRNPIFGLGMGDRFRLARDAADVGERAAYPFEQDHRP